MNYLTLELESFNLIARLTAILSAMKNGFVQYDEKTYSRLCWLLFDAKMRYKRRQNKTNKALKIGK